jgi:predicted GNAT family N-acyltransferase
MITYKKVETAEELQGAFHVRQLVFTKEQGINADADLDTQDIYATHFMTIKNGKIISTVRVFLEEDKAIIGRLVVLKEERNQGVGTKLMKLAIEHARKNNAKFAVSSCQVRKSHLYEKLGYVKKGKEYTQVGIPHVKMILDLKK